MRTGTKFEYCERIEMAIEFILGRLDNPPTAVEIADHAGFLEGGTPVLPNHRITSLQLNG